MINQTQLIKHWQELPWSEIKLKANKHLPKVVLIVLVLLLTQTFAELTWALFTSEDRAVLSQQKNSDSKEGMDTNSLAQPHGANLSEVSRAHLFGEANKQSAVVQKVIDAPETRLKLTLKGVFASTSEKEALAIISSSSGKDTTYHIGQKVNGGTLLHAVYADRVILKRDGRLETLRLPKPKMDQNAISTSNDEPNVRNRPTARPVANTKQRQRLKDMRDTLLKDPAKIWKQVRINPVMENGKIKGYTLAHNDQSLMQTMNIRKTDIITEVNGEPLSDPSTLYGLMGNLSDQQSLQLTIERDGQSQSVELNF